MSDPFITAADLAGYDATLAGVATVAASAIIRAYCGWHIGPSEEATVVLDGNGATILPLPSLHVTAVELVELTEGDTVTDATADVEWSSRGLLRYTRWPTAWRSVEVTFTHGYPLAELEDVKAVARSLAVRALSNPEQVRSKAVLGFSVTYTIAATGDAMALALNGVERAILDHYRLPPTPS